MGVLGVAVTGLRSVDHRAGWVGMEKSLPWGGWYGRLVPVGKLQCGMPDLLQGLRGEAVGAVPSSLSAVPGHLRGGAGWVCLAAVPELCQDHRSDGESLEGVQVGFGCLGWWNPAQNWYLLLGLCSAITIYATYLLAGRTSPLCWCFIVLPAAWLPQPVLSSEVFCRDLMCHFCLITELLLQYTLG